MSTRLPAIVLATVLLSACDGENGRGPALDLDAGDAGAADTGDSSTSGDASGADSGDPAPVACTPIDFTKTEKVSLFVPVTDTVSGLDKLDLLFVIDNSISMEQEQAKLAEQLPKLVRSLVSGVRDDGTTFSPVGDLHVGVVTTDLGTNGSGISLPPHCAGLGDDAKLVENNVGCDTNAPSGYLNYVPSELTDDATLTKAISDFTCLAKVGIDGCGLEQQLEAMYKALAPDTVPFAAGTAGHGNAANAGFLRDEAVLAVVHVSDEEDCSMSDKGMPLMDQDTGDDGAKVPGTQDNLGINIRCVYRSDPAARQSQAELAGFAYEVDRYITKFKETVKPNNPDRILFAAIVGIPEETQRGSYADMLAHPLMDFAIDPMTGLGGDPTNTNTLARDVCRRCKTLDDAACRAAPLNVKDEDGLNIPNPEIVTGAKPAIRFVKVAEGFGSNGLVQSICAESYGPAIDAITDKISHGLGGACLPREFPATTEGVVPCDLIETIPDATDGSACDPARGRTFRGLRVVGGKVAGVTCLVNQIAVTPQHELVPNPNALPGVDPRVGWFYDTFTEKVQGQCTFNQRRKLTFEPAAAEPVGSTLRLDCLDIFPGDAGLPICADGEGDGDPSDSTDAGPGNGGIF